MRVQIYARSLLVPDLAAFWKDAALSYCGYGSGVSPRSLPNLDSFVSHSTPYLEIGGWSTVTKQSMAGCACSESDKRREAGALLLPAACEPLQQEETLKVTNDDPYHSLGCWFISFVRAPATLRATLVGLFGQFGRRG